VLRLHYDLGKVTTRLGPSLLDAFVGCTPPELRQIWVRHIKPHADYYELVSLRAVLQAMCELHIGSWSPDLSGYVSKLGSHRQDIYKTVRTGECFMPLGRQSKLIGYFDEVAHLVSANPKGVSTNELRDTVALIVAYQHAFRPGQTARIKTADVRIFSTGAVH
jgi:hypothetical protein